MTDRTFVCQDCGKVHTVSHDHRGAVCDCGSHTAAMVDATLIVTPASDWREVLCLRVRVSPSGLISLAADPPAARNLMVTGLTLAESFEAFTKYLSDCEELGKEFEVFEGVKLR